MHLSDAINELARFKAVFQAAEKLEQVLAFAAQAEQIQSEAKAIADRVRADIADLQAAKDKAEADYQSATERKDAALKSAADAEGRIGSLSRQVATLQENVNGHLKREEEAAAAADTAQMKLAKAQSDLTQVNAKLAAANERLDALRAKLEA